MNSEYYRARHTRRTAENDRINGFIPILITKLSANNPVTSFGLGVCVEQAQSCPPAPAALANYVYIFTPKHIAGCTLYAIECHSGCI
jgi:hypothetical protein